MQYKILAKTKDYLLVFRVIILLHETGGFLVLLGAVLSFGKVLKAENLLDGYSFVTYCRRVLYLGVDDCFFASVLVFCENFQQML
jgi:hypothetical protein